MDLCARAASIASAHLPCYRQVNAGVSHAFDAEGIRGLTARFDVINLFDTKYQIRNGTGIGVGARQYGPRRGFLAGVAWDFQIRRERTSVPCPVRGTARLRRVTCGYYDCGGRTRQLSCVGPGSDWAARRFSGTQKLI